VDDSWARERVAEGGLSPAEAMRDARAHAVTRWIGADAPDDPPRIAYLRPRQAGYLLLCTDGLWNFFTAPEALGHVVRALPPAAAPVAIARSLTEGAPA